ncbi:flippase [Limosilactobacillus fermentum]|uniref:flippase n=1 Tax=Limosilactobacillus fermentum TaxID=1613 RepID=UPI001108D1E2|nr:flippase [Limosilactobacillus fermentum]TLQ38361.1 flippase [Limosilactobacillus fermentum]
MVDTSVKKNAVLNVIKQACSILFPLITYPYVSRVLGSTSYGIYSFADSIVSYAVLIAGLGISTYAIREGSPIRDNQKKINQFSSEIFSINVISTIVAYLLLFFSIFVSTKIMADRNVIFVRSIMIILTTIGVDWINNIYEDFSYITIRYIVFQTISLVLMFAFVRSTRDILIYTFITVIAAAGGNVLNVFYVRKYVRIKFVLRGLSKHIKPIIILFANNVAVAIYVNSDITMLGFYVTNSQVGIYALASKIYNLAKLMINALIIALMPRLSYIINDKEKYQQYAKVILKYLVVISLPIVSGFVFLSKQIIFLVGSEEYISGAFSLGILAFAIIGAIGGSFFSNCILIEHKEENFILIATSISAFLNIALNFLLIPKFGINGAALTTLIAETIACILEAFYAKRYVPLRKLFSGEMIYSIIGSLLVAIICYLTTSVVNDSVVSLIIAGVLSIGIYILVIMCNSNIRRDVLSFFK